MYGRAQEDKDPAVLRETWVSSLRAGLEAAELELLIKEEDILFPYCGDALRDVTGAEDADHAADVVLPQREQGTPRQSPSMVSNHSSGSTTSGTSPFLLTGASSEILRHLT